MVSGTDTKSITLLASRKASGPAGVDVQHRHRAAGVAGVGGIGAGHGPDGHEHIGHVAGQAVAHHRAVGHAGGVHAGCIQLELLAQAGVHRAHEAHIVHLAVAGIATTAARVPGREPAAGELAVAAGEDGDEAARL